MADQGAASRISAMDGLRGWAALSVVVFHFTWELFGARYPEFRSFLPAFLGSGRLAVAIFFTLSGYVLTVRRWRRTDNPPYYIAGFKRYLRLTIPIFVACMGFWALMALNLTPTQEAAAVVRNKLWLGSIADFQPDFLRALFFGIAGAYGFELKNLYHPFLWTMIVELWGSLIVFAISQSPRGLREPYTPLLLMAAFLLWLFPLAACFPIGALIALLQRDGIIFRHPPNRLESALATLIVIVGVIASAFLHFPSELLSGRTVRHLLPASLVGVAVVFAAVRSVPVSRLLMLPVSQALGRLSFPLYLIHGLVVASFTSLLIVWTGSFGRIDTLDASLIALASILTSVAAAPVLLPVEMFTLTFIKRFGRRPAATD